MWLYFHVPLDGHIRQVLQVLCDFISMFLWMVTLDRYYCIYIYCNSLSFMFNYLLINHITIQYFFFVDLYNDEELKLLESDIAKIRESNLVLDKHLCKMRAEVITLENQVLQEEKENNAIQDQTKILHDYLSNLKRQILSALSQINVPHLNTTVITEDNLEECINQIQTLCFNRNGSMVSSNSMNLGVSEIKVA